MRDDTCVFILSHGRPEDVATKDAIDRYGYTGDWYILTNDSEHRSQYEAKYGHDSVIFIDQVEAFASTDAGDNFDRTDTPLYSRNLAYDIAEDLGYAFFIVFDDDYTNIQYRFDEQFSYNPETVRDLDELLEYAVEFIDSAPVDILCFAQGGDFIGGENAGMASAVQTKRKAMNSFICSVDDRVKFRGTMNDDVNTYVRAAQYGRLFLTANIASIEQEATQQEEGGLTGMYEDNGTYMKSFYTVLYAPSCTNLSELHDRADSRIHHRISWRNAVPKIVPESVKK